MEEDLEECLWKECSSEVMEAPQRCTCSRASRPSAPLRGVVLRHRCSHFGLQPDGIARVLDPVHMNLLTDAGMAAAILLSLSLVVGGTAWFGVPCSTFVFMSRGHTK